MSRETTWTGEAIIMEGVLVSRFLDKVYERRCQPKRQCFTFWFRRAMVSGETFFNLVPDAGSFGTREAADP